MIYNKDSFTKLEKLSAELLSLAEETDESVKNNEKILETLCSLFILLFEFCGDAEQLQVAEKCGGTVVNFLSNKDSFDSDESIHIEILQQALLIVSALCNYDSARCLLVETTPIMKIIIESLSKIQGNETEQVQMRDKLLSCLSTIVRGFVIEAVEAGILEPMIALLRNTECISDQRGSAAIILSLIEPEKGKVIGARVVLSGVVPLLCETFARSIPEDSSANDKVAYRNLGIVGLRCLACILRHQKLARESAMQFFASEKGEQHLKSIIEHANDTSNVSRWLFAAEILVWVASEESCCGLLGRVGGKQALRKVVSEADPYGKWKTLVNQAVSVNELPVLWMSTSIFQREQHAFLALWMNRYVNGGFDVSYDANIVRSKICCNEWLSFATTLLASPDAVTRRHAHSALISLRGDALPSPSRPSSVSSKQSVSSRKNSDSPQKAPPGRKVQSIKAKPKTQNDATNASLYSHLFSPIGLDKIEENAAIEAFTKAKLPLHILLRRGIKLADIEKELINISPGTRLAVMDGLRDFRSHYENAKVVVHEKSVGIEEKAIDIPSIKATLSGSFDGQSDENPVCFISYCWANKPKAQALKQFLEEHNVKCWMDEQQIEGGSMLFEEIDDGISQCEVVVSCLSPDYTKSVNCNREFLLASDRKKATIPVVLEELESWPPRGSLGPLLAGKLYIKMDDKTFQEERQKSTEFRQLVQSVMQLLRTSAKTGP